MVSLPLKLNVSVPLPFFHRNTIPCFWMHNELCEGVRRLLATIQYRDMERVRDWHN